MNLILYRHTWIKYQVEKDYRKERPTNNFLLHSLVDDLHFDELIKFIYLQIVTEFFRFFSTFIGNN